MFKFHFDVLSLDFNCNCRNTVKTFYTAGLLMDILDQFEQVDEEFKEKRKYAKWKAAYIHNCLKNGEVPISGPREIIADDDDEAILHKTLLDADDIKNYTKFEEPSGKIALIGFVSINCSETSIFCGGLKNFEIIC